VEFSPQEGFELRTPSLWSRYPFSIKKDHEDYDYLCVKIPVAGEEMDLKFDTCAENGLNVKECVWQRLRKKLRHVKTTGAHVWLPRSLGWIACQNVVVKGLQVGRREIKNAKIAVFPNDSAFPKSHNCQGLLGMRYFRQTVIVFDFERESIWIRNDAVN
jgi:hypothetical protein